MGIGVSILLFAIGAILSFAVNVSTEGVNIHAVGNILMFVGAIGGLISLIFWTSWGGFGGNGYSAPHDSEIVERRRFRP